MQQQRGMGPLPIGPEVSQESPAARYLRKAEMAMAGRSGVSQEAPPADPMSGGLPAMEMLRQRRESAMQPPAAPPPMQAPAQKPDYDAVARVAEEAKRAGIVPPPPKGEYSPGRSAPVSGKSVHALMMSEAIQRAVDAWRARNPGKSLRGPMMQTLVRVAEGIPVSAAQAARLAKRFQRARDESTANRYALAGAKRSLTRGGA